jgi:magnesium-transporting ATPase (P-type)
MLVEHEPMSMATSDCATGLTSDEARRRLAAHGTNAVQDVVQHPITRALRKLWAPVPWMLEAAVLLQLALGEYGEASAVAFLLVFNAGLGFFQEGRAQATLEALKSRLAVTAMARGLGGIVAAVREGRTTPRAAHDTGTGEGDADRGGEPAVLTGAIGSKRYARIAGGHSCSHRKCYSRLSG